MEGYQESDAVFCNAFVLNDFVYAGRLMVFVLRLVETSRGTGDRFYSKLGCETHTDEKTNPD